MRRSPQRPLLLAALCAGLLWAFLALGASPPDEPSVPSEVVRGVSLGLFASDPAYDYGDLLAELRQRGATDVLLVVNWTQRDLSAHDIGPRDGWSPAPETLARTVEQARALKLRVGLMPVVQLRHADDGAWRGLISPKAGPDVWFDAYRAFALPLAELAQAHGVERLYVGSELSSLERHDAHWRALIRDVRARYGGRVSYSANWDRFEQVPFWDALDELGVSAYFSLSASPDPDPDALARAWEEPTARLEALRQRTGKPLVFSEVGYPTHLRAAERPWEERGPLGDDPSHGPRLQARLYDAFCDHFAQRPVLDGFYIWNWFGVGGPRDLSYSPRGKPAAARLEACLRRAWPSPPSAALGAQEGDRR